LASGRLIELGIQEGLHEEFFAITLHRRFPNPLVAELPSAYETRGYGG